MITQKNLEEYRATVQNIIDKYLPEDKRFSVKDFTLEGLSYLASLFLEKDPKKRDEIYEEIEIKRKEAEKKFKKAERDFLKSNDEIMRKKEEYDRMFNSIKDINSLFDDITTNQELDSTLKNF